MSALRKFFRRQSRHLLGLGTFGLFALIWELLPAFGLVDPFFISSPSRILKAAQWLFAHGFWIDIQVSLNEFLLGMVLATLAGVALGLALGWYATLSAMFEPFMTMLNATPRVALIPIFILWLGIGIASKVAAVFLGAFFPLVITVIAGVRSMDETLIKCARSFGANDRQIFSTLVLPSCIPFVVAGLHIAVGRGLVGVVIGEMLAAQRGVGHMMSQASSTFQIDKMFVGVLLLAGFGFFITEILKRLEKHFEKWRP